MFRAPGTRSAPATHRAVRSRRKLTRRGPGGWPASRFLLKARSDLRGARLIALANLIHQRDGFLEHADLSLQGLEQAVARGHARWVAGECRPALRDRIVDHQEILLQRGGQ